MAGSSAQSGSPFVPGTLIAGKYRLIKSIGEGAMGVVWSAVNEATSGHVALKLIWKPEPEYRLRLIREAQACGRLRHKNVIQIHDVGQTDSGDPFLVMELLSGETLQELLARKRRLPPAEAAGIGRDVARGLAVAHAAGIIHRDLKPANIFLHNQPGEDFPVVKVLDFGVAKNSAVNDGLHTAIGGAVGSPMYMSPEQANRDPNIDSRADIWSLGVVLFEMLTGERPFRGDLAEVLHQIQHGEIPTVGRRIRRIDPDLDAIVAGCLVRDREQRLGPAGEVANLLDEHGTPAGREPLPSLMEEALSDRVPVAGASSSSGGALSSGSGSHPNAATARVPEPRPSSSGSGQASPGYGAGQSPGYGAGQSPGYGAGQSPGYGAGQSPGYGAGRGGIGLTPAGVSAHGALHQSGSHAAPLQRGGSLLDDDAATHRLEPRMLPQPRPSSSGDVIGPSGTIRIDPDVVEQAIAARGGAAVPGVTVPLMAPPAPNVPAAPAAPTASVSSPLSPAAVKNYHPTLPLISPPGISPGISTTAPLFQDAAPAPPPSKGAAGGNDGKKKTAIAIGGIVGVAALLAVVLFFAFGRKGATQEMEGSLPPTGTATATATVTSPVPVPTATVSAEPSATPTASAAPTASATSTASAPPAVTAPLTGKLTPPPAKTTPSPPPKCATFDIPCQKKLKEEKEKQKQKQGTFAPKGI